MRYMHSFEHLPDELILQILHHVSLFDLVRVVSALNRRLRRLTYVNSLWHTVDFDRPFPFSAVEKILKTCRKPVSLDLTNCTFPSTYDESINSSVVVDASVPSKFLEDFEAACSSYSVAHFVSGFTNLETLIVTNNDKLHRPETGRPCIASIVLSHAPSTLRILHMKHDLVPSTVASEVLPKLTNLESLSLVVQRSLNFSSDVDDVILALSNASNLRTLHLTTPSIPNHCGYWNACTPNLSKLVRLTDLSLSGIPIEAAKLDEWCTRLTRFRLKGWEIPPSVALSFRGCSQLKSISIKQVNLDFLDVRHCPTLTSIVIDKRGYSPPTRIIVVSCTSLQTLAVDADPGSPVLIERTTP
mmetsp:Transcript_40504/g.65688  ORF Transcript_40504/g.65688 Transcript_40504/m.65688 type:complete len:357 (-) Transcript_40504:116-1186(-)